MEYRVCRNNPAPYNDLNGKISLLGLGTMRLPLRDAADQTSIDEEKAQEIFDYAYAHGVNYFDTAYPYHGGESEPFVGRAGKLLDDMLELIDLDRSRNVYIANIVKCRPPQNRDPLNTEQDACIGYLRNQVALIRPKIIVCLGRVAAMRLIREDFKISREHGQWVERSGVWMTALYHPAAILRDPSKRPATFDDLKSLQSKIRQVCSRTYCTPDRSDL